MPTLLTGLRVHRVDVTVQTTDVDNAVIDGGRGRYVVASLEAPSLLSSRCIDCVKGIVEAANEDDIIRYRRTREDIATGVDAPAECYRALHSWTGSFSSPSRVGSEHRHGQCLDCRTCWSWRGRRQGCRRWPRSRSW